jgi:hypothetical protein
MSRLGVCRFLIRVLYRLTAYWFSQLFHKSRTSVGADRMTLRRAPRPLGCQRTPLLRLGPDRGPVGNWPSNAATPPLPVPLPLWCGSLGAAGTVRRRTSRPVRNSPAWTSIRFAAGPPDTGGSTLAILAVAFLTIAVATRTQPPIGTSR